MKNTNTEQTSTEGGWARPLGLSPLRPVQADRLFFLPPSQGFLLHSSWAGPPKGKTPEACWGPPVPLPLTRARVTASIFTSSVQNEWLQASGASAQENEPSRHWAGLGGSMHLCHTLWWVFTHFGLFQIWERIILIFKSTLILLLTSGLMFLFVLALSGKCRRPLRHLGSTAYRGVPRGWWDMTVAI